MLVGDAEIDAEHEKIFEAAERTCSLSREHEDPEKLVSAFSEFGDLLFRAPRRFVWKLTG